MKKTLTIAGIAFAMLAVACGLGYLEVLMFKAMDLTIHGVPYVTWISNLIRTYWPWYAFVGCMVVAVDVFCAKSIYSDLKA